MGATSPEQASLEQASLSQPLTSCADLFCFSICGLLCLRRSLSGEEHKLVYRCFAPACLEGHAADPAKNLQMVLEMTSLCSMTNPAYVHLLCTGAPRPDSSQCFYFFLSDDCLARWGAPIPTCAPTQRAPLTVAPAGLASAGGCASPPAGRTASGSPRYGPLFPQPGLADAPLTTPRRSRT